MYNASKTIERALNSIKEQTFKCNYQIIVVNDGSKDNSQEIVEKYIADNPQLNITLINQLNGGVSKSINIKNILKSAAILGIVLYFFGVIGNIRQTQTKTEKTYVLRIAGATDKFLESGVPQEFYWSYIYLISPIGNLQNIVDHKADIFDTKNIGFFTATELLPDFISKRVSSIFDYDEIINKDLGSRYLVTINLNAPTVYYNSYLNLGSAGMYIMYFIMMMAAVFYPKILNRINNPYYLSAVASLNSILFLSMFNNMWFNIGTVLLWPIILDVFRRLRFS
jgi:glycosyltransferase involved in cell wall biosynthesis